jgi:hypothetical protein
MRASLIACAFCAGMLPAQQLVWEVQGVPGQFTFGLYSASGSGLMANLGDINGDSNDDLIVIGADVVVQRSQLWILSGSDGTTLRTVPQVGGQQEYYLLVSSAGDMNGDGTRDYVVTIRDASVAATMNKIEVRSGVDDSVIWQKPGSWSAQFGYALLGSVDLDADGRPDLAITVPNADGQRLGAVYAYRNDGAILWQRFGTTEQPIGMQARFETLDRAGDVDGDGADDLVVGGYDAAAGAGAAVVLSGRTGKTLQRGLGPSNGPIIGVQVAGLGDIDGDGVPDFAAGADYAKLIMAFSGRSGAPLFTWNGTPTQFGVGVASRVDLDQDGLPDLVAGSVTGDVIALSGRDGSELFHLQRNGAFGQAVETLRAQPGNPFGLFVVSSPQYLTTSSGYRGRISAYRGAPPSVQPLGATCEGTLARVPRIGMQDLGSSGARVHLSGAPPGAQALLLLGISTSSWQMTPLPLALEFAGFPGCTLFTSVEATALVTVGAVGTAAGYASFDVPVPLAIGTSQVTLHGQWLVLGSGEMWPGALSAGLTWQH